MTYQEAGSLFLNNAFLQRVKELNIVNEKFEAHWPTRAKILFCKLTDIYDKDFAVFPDFKVFLEVRYINPETKQVSEKPHGNSLTYSLRQMPEHIFKETKRTLK